MSDTLQQFRADLENALRRHAVADGISGVRKLSGGASQETWLIEAEGSQGRQQLVLRRAIPGLATESSAAVPMTTEAEVIRGARAGGARVPDVALVLEDEDKLGQGFVTRFIDGETLGARICRDPALANARSVLAQQCGEDLALIHSLVPDPSWRLRLATPHSEVERLEQSYRDLPTPRPVFALALAWLERHLIAPEPRPALVHGDFRNGNLIVGPNGLRAVLDWEAVHMGDPAEDLAWFCAPSWRFGHLELVAGGFARREDLLESYSRHSGRSIDAGRLHFWEVFSILRWGLICASAQRSFASGVDTSPQRAMIARRASEAELDILRAIAPRPRYPH